MILAPLLLISQHLLCENHVFPLQAFPRAPPKRILEKRQARGGVPPKHSVFNRCSDIYIFYYFGLDLSRLILAAEGRAKMLRGLSHSQLRGSQQTYAQDCRTLFWRRLSGRSFPRVPLRPGFAGMTGIHRDSPVLALRGSPGVRRSRAAV